MASPRILIADNVPSDLNVRARFLETCGYEVLRASSLEEAQSLLQDRWLHLAILDIRLVNDNDEKDVSGLTLAESVAPAVPKIILTGFPSWHGVRVALGKSNVTGAPAVDYVAKKEGLKVLAQHVESALVKHSGTNWDLKIEWGDHEVYSLLTRVGGLVGA